MEKKMSKNPTQALPSNILALRQRRNKEMISVAKKGVLLRLIIIVAEGIGYGCFHSSSLLLDAISSLFDIDALSSVFATIALLIGGFFPSLSHIVDHLGALMISLFMIGLGSYAAIKNFHQLLDKIPDKKYFALVKEAALSVEGVKDTEKIR